MTLKAIQTEYKGYLFRSRLEARWAVFFDALGIPFIYEPEGFDLDGEWYLPDFKCGVAEGCWVEIKPSSLSSREEELLRSLSSDVPVASLALIGQPWLKELHVQMWVDGRRVTRGSAWRFFWALLCSSVYSDWLLTMCSVRLSKMIGLCFDRIQDAFKAARQARFEHGEKP